MADGKTTIRAAKWTMYRAAAQSLRIVAEMEAGVLTATVKPPEEYSQAELVAIEEAFLEALEGDFGAPRGSGGPG